MPCLSFKLAKNGSGQTWWGQAEPWPEGTLSPWPLELTPAEPFQITARL